MNGSVLLVERFEQKLQILIRDLGERETLKVKLGTGCAIECLQAPTLLLSVAFRTLFRLALMLKAASPDYISD